MPNSILKFQIGPVQEFIAQARSTRDLWSGSYLLSWLVAEGIRHLLAQPGVTLIFPASSRQPLIDLTMQPKPHELLTPNLPNIFVASVSGDAQAIAKAVADGIEAEWERIAGAVWRQGAGLGMPAHAEERFSAQVRRHWSMTWVVSEATGDYKEDFRRNGWQLDAVRQTRSFIAWSAGGWETTGCEKDSLSGREEAVVGGEAWHKGLHGEYAHLFKHAESLGAISLVKRVWHRAYLRQRKDGFRAAEIRSAIDRFKIRSTRAIAARDEKEDDYDDVDLAQGEKYLAAIAFDGDSIGAWVSGDFVPADKLQALHQQFSACLSDFALNRVRPIVEEQYDGVLIYAGGDDVVALVPADMALDCAEALRTALIQATKGIQGQDKHGKPIQPDASAGIAIAHFKSPLQDLIKAAQDAERYAKSTIGRPAFSLTLMKRSGETEVWGARWISGGRALYEGIAKAMSEGRLTGKFPYRVCKLLSSYLTTRTGITRQNDVADFQTHAVIRQEFAHALDRQGQGAGAAEVLQLLDTYLSQLGTEPQPCIEAIIGLCKTVAFTQRNRPD